jgi:hypothetical protein
MRNATSSTIVSPTILWGARILTVVILSFWGFFIIAHLWGNAGASSRGLMFEDYASLSAIVASLLGLGLSFKWERVGATIALTAVAIGAVMNWKVLLFPGTLIPITAALFLLHSYLQYTARRNHAAASR